MWFGESFLFGFARVDCGEVFSPCTVDASLEPKKNAGTILRFVLFSHAQVFSGRVNTTIPRLETTASQANRLNGKMEDMHLIRLNKRVASAVRVHILV